MERWSSRRLLALLARQAAGLFTEDGVWDGGPALGVARGRDEIAARLAEPTLVFSRHLFLRPRIEVTGEVATGRWELLSPCTAADGTSLWMSGSEDGHLRPGRRRLAAPFDDPDDVLRVTGRDGLAHDPGLTGPRPPGTRARTPRRPVHHLSVAHRAPGPGVRGGQAGGPTANVTEVVWDAPDWSVHCRWTTSPG